MTRRLPWDISSSAGGNDRVSPDKRREGDQVKEAGAGWEESVLRGGSTPNVVPGAPNSEGC